MKQLNCLLLLFAFTCPSSGNFPLLDVDTNMRIVLVPQDTPAGTIIYRLRASDSDNNFPLSFEVLGAVGKGLLSLEPIGCVETESLCQADVVLKKGLDVGRNYEFQLQVRDTTGDYTRVHATLTSTPGVAAFNPLFGPRIMHIAEDCLEGSILERFEVLKSDLNSRFVHLEIRDKEERIGLRQRLVSHNRTEGTLFLRRKLDYEAQPWFTFQILAMNAWTNSSVDTRNVLVSDVIVAVHDVQDTPPVFTILSPSVELNSSLKMGDLVTRVEAVDGDKQKKRLIRYGFLTDSNPFVVFFDLDSMTGEIRLRRNISELFQIAKPSEPIRMTIIAEEISQDAARYGRSVSPSLERTMGNITFWFGTGTALGPPKFSADKYVGELPENSLPGTLVQFGTFLAVSHSSRHEAIGLSLSLPGGGKGSFIGPISAHSFSQSQLVNAFELVPSQGVGNFSFQVRVSSQAGSLLDFEMYKEIKLSLIGRSLNGLSSEAELLIHLRDENDNSPIFSLPEYRVEIPEHSPVGSKVVQVRATDKDEGQNGQIMYSGLVGSDAFRLDLETGEITVDKPDLLDRETEPEIRLYVEAKDGGYSEFSNPAGVRNMASTTILVKLHDKNDNQPEFLQKYYQAVLNPDRTSFKNPIFVKAIDPDEGPNGQIKYQSLDSKFFVDPASGEVRVRGVFQTPKSGPYLGSFRVRAYDLGNPQQSSDTVVQLFSEEMVTREIQIVFPDAPEKIRQNQTNIEKMLSSLTGGIVGIKKITPYNPNSRRAGLVEDPNLQNNSPVRWMGQDDPAGRRLEEEDPPPRPKFQNRAIAVKEKDDSSSGQNDAPEKRKSAGLSSASETSLVTATVQYPASATPTVVDLAEFQRAYGRGNGNGNGVAETRSTERPDDTEMIKLYEAENRALFWLLISFLLILLILFAIFLCCIYCPCCWLYGHCYSGGRMKGEPDRERIIERTVIEKEKRPLRKGRKTYPSEETSSAEPEDYRSRDRGHGHSEPPRHRREAWSGEERERGKGSWRRRPPTPYGQERSGRKRPPHPQEEDVALEDWDYTPAQGRLADKAEEIGPRWRNMQHPQTITVPVPMSLMQQMQPPPSQRRVVYAGEQHPGDEDFVRRPRQEEVGPGPAYYVQSEVERSQVHIPRHYPAEAQVQTQENRQRQTRFFKTETGEVLQFEDFEGEEGKELLLKRYMEDQASQPQEGEEEELEKPPKERKQGKEEEAVSRPRAAVLAKRPHPPAKEMQKEKKGHKSKVTEKAAKSKKQQPQPSQSLSEGESEELPKKSSKKAKASKSKSRSSSGGSRSRTRSRSESPSRLAKSQEEGQSSSKSEESPPPVVKKKKEKEAPPPPTKSKSKSKSTKKESTKSKEKAEKVEASEKKDSQVVDINVIPPSSAAITEENEDNKVAIPEKRQVETEADQGSSTALQTQPAQPPQEETFDDEDSGIGIAGVASKRKNRIMEKKSVFTIAYDEVANKALELRPDTGNNSQ